MEENETKQERLYAGFWLRFVAYLIDSLILGVPMAIFSIVVVFILLGSSGAFENLDYVTAETEVSGAEVFAIIASYLIIAFVTLIVTVGYFAGFHASKMQATPGKRALNLKVVNLEGERISFWRGVGRYFAMILSGILYIGYIMAAFTEKKQALHDMIAGTYVIKK